jgi:hypothetical protein
MRAGLGEVLRIEGQSPIVTLVLDPGIKLMAAKTSSFSFPPLRSDGRPWVYRLEDNLNDKTHELNAAEMVQAVAASVTNHMRRLGF